MTTSNKHYGKSSPAPHQVGKQRSRRHGTSHCHRRGVSWYCCLALSVFFARSMETTKRNDDGEQASSTITGDNDVAHGHDSHSQRGREVRSGRWCLLDVQRSRGKLARRSRSNHRGAETCNAKTSGESGGAVIRRTSPTLAKGCNVDLIVLLGGIRNCSFACWRP